MQVYSDDKYFTHEKKGNMHKHIPGWNEYVIQAHTVARVTILLWQSNSKPHVGHIRDLGKQVGLDSNTVRGFVHPMKIMLRLTHLPRG